MNFKHLAANGNNLLAKQAAKVHSVTVNTKGSAGNTLTLFDNALGDTSGTVIAIIDTVNIVQPTLIFDLHTLLGLSATLATGGAADVTINFQ